MLDMIKACRGHAAGPAVLGAIPRQDVLSLCDEAERDRMKWSNYEKNYILPCFVWASEMGIDLERVVADHEGHNCVELLVRELRMRIDQAIEASDNDGGSANDAIQDMLQILTGDDQ